MLIDFSVTNYRSIKDKQTFSMQPIKRIDELPEHIIQNGKHSALSSAIIYGRNASGKSNLLKAMGALVSMVSEGNKVNRKIDEYDSYKFDRTSALKSVKIELNFIAEDKIKYLYCVDFSENEIIEESLFSFPNNRETKLFVRELNKPIDFGINFKGRKKEIEETLYPNQLLLSKVGNYRIDTLYYAYFFLSKKIIQYSLSFDGEHKEDEYLMDFRINEIFQNRDSNFKANLEKLLIIADTSIVSLREEMKDILLSGNQIYKEPTLVTEHYLFENNVKIGTTYIKANEESEGTIKLIYVGSKILDVLEKGGVLIIDELDKGFHALLTRTIINLFHNPKTNPNGAQLIFATHDVSLLDNELFRRDQIWFSEKGNDGASTYYSLADLKGIRAGVPLEKYYLKGAFGATPIINEHDLVFNFGEKNEQK